MRPMTPVGWSLCAFAALLPVSVALANIGWALVLAALLYARARGVPWPLDAVRGPLWRPLLAFIAATLLCDSFGVDPLHSLRFLHQDLHKVWIAALLAVAFAVELPNALAAALLAGSAFVAALGVAQYLGGLSGDPNAAVRAHGFVHPVAFGEQMALLALGPLALGLSGTAPRRAAAAAAGVGALLAAALIFSNTRGAIGAFALGAAAVVLALPQLRKLAPAILAASVVLVAAADLHFPNRSVILQVTGLRPDPTVGDQSARLDLWEVAVRMGLDNPVTGVGVNNYRGQLPRYLSRRFEDSQSSWGTAHSLYFHHFAERGAVGLAALAWLLGTMAWRAWRRAVDAPGVWTLWALGGTAAFLVMNLTEVALQTEVVWLLTWTLWLAGEAEFRKARP